MNNFEKTKYFNQTFGILVNETYQPNIFTEKWGVVKYRLDLINEEISELEEGCEKNSFLEVLDALCDILYVTYGMGNSIGINLDQEFKKMFGNSDKTNFQVVKSIYSSQDDGSSFTGKLEESNPKAIYELVRGMREYYDKLFNICSNTIKEDIEIVRKSIVESLIGIIHFCYYIGCLIKVDIDYAFNLVHEANMTKACKTEQEAKESVEKYLQEKEDYKGEDEYPYQYPSYKLSADGKFYIIFNDDKREKPKFAGKILKSKNWCEPDFLEFQV